MEENRSRIIEANLSQLDLDKNNYRLAKYGVIKDKDQLINILWKNEKASEIAESIIATGYIDGDPIVVRKDKGGKFLVQEGNRRITALKVLSDKILRAKFKIKTISSAIRLP